MYTKLYEKKHLNGEMLLTDLEKDQNDYIIVTIKKKKKNINWTELKSQNHMIKIINMRF